MKINIRELREHPVDLDVNLSARELDLKVEGADFAEQVTGRLHVRMVAEEVFVQGELWTKVIAPCVRCLKRVDVPIEIQNLRLVFLPKPHDLSPTDELIDPDEEDVSYYEHDVVDMLQDLRELILLELPNYPVCEGECEMQHYSKEFEPGKTEEPEWKNKLKKIKINPK